MTDSTTGRPKNARASAYFAAPVSEFLGLSSDEVLGKVAAGGPFDVTRSQLDAWTEEPHILRDALRGIDGWLYLEFDVPRLGSRVDAILISGPAIFPIEFKVGATNYERADVHQAWDYALDLKNFHKASHDAPIFPILVATKSNDSHSHWGDPAADGVYPPFHSNAQALRNAVLLGLECSAGRPRLNGEQWGQAPYWPTPTIIQAAQALYAQHSVEAISRNDAGATNLSVTSRRVEDLIDHARARGEKAVIFITGVPGAGKTLVGLNIATQKRDETDSTHAVFLSGNGPLVAVLREALIRDEVARSRRQGKRVRKGVVGQRVKPFIQNVHHFRDEGLRDPTRPPHDRVVIFDEAQRAWNQGKTSDFMRRRKGLAAFSQSEPEFLLSYMDRHADWTVVVCLVGGGQEIHTGEAGIAAWLEAVRDHFPAWSVYVSPNLNDSEYLALETLSGMMNARVVQQDASLHLAVSLRSFRAEKVSAFVKAVLDCDLQGAQALLTSVHDRYPIALTRDLSSAKRWIRGQARGSERYGLVASSQAQRLKPHAIDVRVNIDPVQWFLNDASDTRSSFYLEDAATEFQVQGLELDWVCMTWDADLRFTGRGWGHHEFRGTKWNHIRAEERKQYLLNAYRVLLTRARQGMVIFVPFGDKADPTRDPLYYDQTFEYLKNLGIQEITQ